MLVCNSWVTLLHVTHSKWRNVNMFVALVEVLNELLDVVFFTIKWCLSYNPLTSYETLQWRHSSFCHNKWVVTSRQAKLVNCDKLAKKWITIFLASACFKTFLWRHFWTEENLPKLQFAELCLIAFSLKYDFDYSRLCSRLQPSSLM